MTRGRKEGNWMCQDCRRINNSETDICDRCKKKKEEQVQERVELTKEQKAELAFKTGKRHERLVCPVCTMSKVGVKRFEIPQDPEIIQVRYNKGGRRIGGFFKKADECVHLSKLKDTHPEVYENLKAEITRLYLTLTKEE